MSIGPSPYDELCANTREELGAEALMLIVVGGKDGSSVSVKADWSSKLHLAVLLRYIASDMEREVETEKLNKKKGILSGS
jgi:hypothetical protein